MKNVVVDFESYYDAELSVSTMGVPNYVKATEAYLVSVVNDEIEFCGTPAQLLTQTGNTWMGDPELQFWAANSNFDSAWWHKYFPPTRHPWKCILDRAAFHQFPRDLVGVAKVACGVLVDKSTRNEMKGVRYEELPPARQQEVSDYCLNDSQVEWDALHKLGPMTSIEDEIAEHTRALNRTGVHIDLDKVERDLKYLERIHYDAIKGIPWAEDRPPFSQLALAEMCLAMGLTAPSSIDKRNAECTAFMKANPRAGEVIETMRTARGANTKTKKLETLLRTVCDGVMPLELLYCGARHTRRWSSRGFNVQNLDKEPKFQEVMSEWPEFAGQKPGIFLREYLVPPPGHVFGILDFTQIEPRCLNWLVGNEEMLGAMRAGWSIYEAHAKATMGWTGAKGTLKKEPLRYKFAKERVLSLGYGMGAVLFHVRANSLGLNITMEESEEGVRDFRQTNRLITDLWKQYDEQIKDAAKQPDHRLRMVMPTGEYLDHFTVQGSRTGGFQSFTIKGDNGAMSRQPRLWGGTLTENVTQRMARDVLAVSILRLEAAGFRVVFHAHDEIILALPKNGAKKALQEAAALMSVPPEWAPGLPVGVEGDLCDHYTKLT